MDYSFLEGSRHESIPEFEIRSAGLHQFPSYVAATQSIYNPRAHSPLPDSFEPEMHSTLSSVVLTQRLDSVSESGSVVRQDMVLPSVTMVNTSPSLPSVVTEPVVDTGGNVTQPLWEEPESINIT